MQPQFPPIVYLICPVVSRYCDHYASIEFNLLISRVVAFAQWPIISPHGRMEGRGQMEKEGQGGLRKQSISERKLGGNQVWKWKGTRRLGEIAFDRLSRKGTVSSPSPSLRLTRFHGTRFVFSSRVSFLRALVHVFGANGWSRELNRISYQARIRACIDLMARKLFSSIPLWRGIGQGTMLSDGFTFPESRGGDVRKYRIEIPLIWSYRRISLLAFDRELDRDYNLLPLMDGARLRTMRDRTRYRFAQV